MKASALLALIALAACSSPPPPQPPVEATAVEPDASPEPAPAPEPEPVAPEAETTTDAPAPALVVAVNAAGEISVDGAVVAPADLVATFTSAREQDPAVSLLVKPDPSADYARVMEIIDAAKKAGITKYAIEK